MTGNKRIECLVFSRIVGYYQPVRQWNKGKQKEWKDRVNYTVPKEPVGGMITRAEALRIAEAMMDEPDGE